MATAYFAAECLIWNNGGFKGTYIPTHLHDINGNKYSNQWNFLTGEEFKQLSIEVFPMHYLK